jgi:hypothetical protein
MKTFQCSVDSGGGTKGSHPHSEVAVPSMRLRYNRAAGSNDTESVTSVTTNYLNSHRVDHEYPRASSTEKKAPAFSRRRLQFELLNITERLGRTALVPLP